MQIELLFLLIGLIPLAIGIAVNLHWARKRRELNAYHAMIVRIAKAEVS